MSQICTVCAKRLLAVGDLSVEEREAVSKAIVDARWASAPEMSDEEALNLLAGKEAAEAQEAQQAEDLEAWNRAEEAHLDRACSGPEEREEDDMWKTGCDEFGE